MTAQVNQLEENVDSIIDTATNNARKAANAGVGVAATVRETVVKLYEDAGAQTNDFAVKGKEVTKARREAFNDAFNEFVEPYQERITNFSDDLEARFNQATESVLGRLNIPTADSIEKLNKKLASLDRKINKLAKEK